MYSSVDSIEGSKQHEVLSRVFGFMPVLVRESAVFLCQIWQQTNNKHRLTLVKDSKTRASPAQADTAYTFIYYYCFYYEVFKSASFFIPEF